MEVNFLEYIAKPVLIIVPVLIILGAMIKRTEGIPDKFIPLILLAFGVAFCVSIIGWDNYQTIIMGVVQGILVAGVAVFGNQAWKQLHKHEVPPAPKPPKKEIGFSQEQSSEKENGKEE